MNNLGLGCLIITVSFICRAMFKKKSVFDKEPLSTILGRASCLKHLKRDPKCAHKTWKFNY